MISSWPVLAWPAREPDPVRPLQQHVSLVAVERPPLRLLERRQEEVLAQREVQAKTEPDRHADDDGN